MKYLLTLILFSIPMFAFSQNLPAPSSMYVVTNCFLHEGYTLTDAVEEGRNSPFDGPLNIAFRQPIATPQAGENEFMRIVAWENLAAWVDAGAASTDINTPDTYSCNESRRRFFTSRELGENSGLSLDDGSTLLTVTACTLKHGVSHSDAYDWLNARTLEREARGDTRVSSMILGVLGRAENGGELGRLFGVRSAGRSASEMAMAMDRIWSEDGQAPDYAMTPAESCQNPVLYRTFFVNSN